MVNLEALERKQTEAENQLLRLLIQGRVREALMSCRSLERISQRYQEAVEDLFLRQELSDRVRAKIREHTAGSLDRQKAAVHGARRLMDALPEGSRERTLLAQISSTAGVCARRNELVRRMALISLGRSLAEAGKRRAEEG